MDEFKLDALVIGGGIAGLWTLNRLVRQGFDAVLFERNALGSGQTVLSQGIIHGGAKYTLQGALSGAANAIADMPARWRRCLAGDGELDLSDTRVLSPAHFFWTAGGLSDRMTAFFASKAMRGRTRRVAGDDRPAIFRNPSFQGQVYRLDELVLDVPSLLRNLAAPVADRLFRVDPLQEVVSPVTDAEGRLSLEIPAYGLRLRPRFVVMTAGEGYPALATHFRLHGPAMQLRPLHMAMVSHDHAPDLYAHCIGTSSRPLLTVTTHPGDGRRKTWYLGGDLAESSNDLNSQGLIEKARKSLSDLLPWVKLENPVWKTVRVNRAEPSQPDRRRPDASFVQAHGPYLVAWPTKLALAPDLAEQIIGHLDRPTAGGTTASAALAARLPLACVADSIWEGI